MRSGYKDNKRIRWVLLALGMAVVVAITTAFVIYRRAGGIPREVLQAVQTTADMVIANIRQTAVKDGARSWQLDAARARLNGKKMILDQPVVIFYMKDGGLLNLKADEGVLNTSTKDIAVSGHVVVTFDNYRMESQKLYYNHQRQILYTDTAVSIAANEFQLAAGNMSIDLNSQITSFDGGVNGTVHEALRL
jgi:LPS export ABC transporter protein LptC